eukprot:2695851-Alexandrium_andersonii.AAC.2
MQVHDLAISAHDRLDTSLTDARATPISEQHSERPGAHCAMLGNAMQHAPLAHPPARKHGNARRGRHRPLADVSWLAKPLVSHKRLQPWARWTQTNGKQHAQDICCYCWFRY